MSGLSGLAAGVHQRDGIGYHPPVPLTPLRTAYCAVHGARPMSRTIEIQQLHHLGRDAAYHRVVAWQDRVRQQFGVTARWLPPAEDGSLLAELGGKVSGHVWVRAEDVFVRLTLGSIAGMFASRIEKGLREALAQSLA